MQFRNVFMFSVKDINIEPCQCNKINFGISDNHLDHDMVDSQKFNL